MPNDMSNIKRITTSFHTAQEARTRLADKKLAMDAHLAELLEHAKTLGFTPATKPADFLGAEQVYQARVPVRGVEQVEFEIVVQNLLKTNTRDKWALFVVRIAAGQNGETYGFLLEAPGGNAAKVREWTVNARTGKVERAHSWWTRMKACLKESCASACVGSLLSCPMTDWTTYLTCVAASCGGCWVRCAACATCKCKWYCRWGAGCCKD